MRRRTGAPAVLLCMLAGCGAEPTGASWELRASSAEVRERAAVVEAFIVQGGCNGSRVLYRADVGAGAPGPRPPVLDAGRYGFAGRARNSDCRTIARGCLDVTLPGDRDHYEVVLEPVGEEPACEASACRSGRCAGEIVSDAGAQPPLRDARPPFADAGGGVPDANAGSPDAGGSPRCRPDDEGCYVLRSAPVQWQVAKNACRALDGHLVQVDDAEEHAWLLSAFGTDLDVWIGLTDADEEGSFEWVDGDEPDFTAWAPGQPDEHPPGEDCVALRGSTWEDRFCKQQRAYLCEL